MVGLRLEKQALRSVEQLHALVTIYGFKKDAPGYLLNFLQSCFVEKTFVQKNWISLAAGGAVLVGLGIWKRAELERVAQRIRGRFFRRLPAPVYPQPQLGAAPYQRVQAPFVTPQAITNLENKPVLPDHLIQDPNYRDYVFGRSSVGLQPFQGNYAEFSEEVFEMIKVFIQTHFVHSYRDYTNGKQDQTLNENKLLRSLHCEILGNGGIYNLFLNLQTETEANKLVRRLFLARGGIYEKVMCITSKQSRVNEAYVKLMMNLLRDSYEAVRGLEYYAALPDNIQLLPS